MSIRIHALAKKLNVTSKELIDFINRRQDKYCLEIKTPSNAIAPIYAEAITNDFSANAFYSYAIDQKWSVFGAARGGFAAEEGADLSDGGRLIAGGGVGYVVDENLAFGIGMMAVSRMDNTWLPLPLGYLRWKIDEKLSLRTLNGIALVYDVFGDSSLLLNVSGEYDNSYFRLKKDGGTKRSVGDNFVNIAVGATYNIGKYLYVSGSAGANVYRKLCFRRGGNSSDEYSCDPAPVFFVHLGCKL